MGSEQERLRTIISSACNKEGIAKHCPARIAEALAEAGIGSKKQAVEEFIFRLRSYTRLSTDGVSYRESVDVRAIDNLFIEIYGEHK